jgi:hypothetical protein
MSTPWRVFVAARCHECMAFLSVEDGPTGLREKGSAIQLSTARGVSVRACRRFVAALS